MVAPHTVEVTLIWTVFPLVEVPTEIPSVDEGMRGSIVFAKALAVVVADAAVEVTEVPLIVMVHGVVPVAFDVELEAGPNVMVPTAKWPHVELPLVAVPNSNGTAESPCALSESWNSDPQRTAIARMNNAKTIFLFLFIAI
jgi:hypothetical protein